MDSKKIKILFFGDLAGKPGRLAVCDYLKDNSEKYDFIILDRYGKNNKISVYLLQFLRFSVILDSV